MAPIRFGRVSPSTTTTAPLLLESERSPMMRRRVAAVVDGCVLMAILFGYELEVDDGKDTLLQMMILLEESPSLL